MEPTAVAIVSSVSQQDQEMSINMKMLLMQAIERQGKH